MSDPRSRRKDPGIFRTAGPQWPRLEAKPTGNHLELGVHQTPPIYIGKIARSYHGFSLTVGQVRKLRDWLNWWLEWRAQEDRGE